MINRRRFILAGSLAGVATLAGSSLKSMNREAGKRIGIIGLDTSHSTAFTRALNKQEAGNSFGGYRIVAAYPPGSLDIQSSVERIEGYTKEVQKLGVEIVDSIDALLEKVDFVLLETNDGRRHLEQALPVLKAGKRMFIDKPMTASLADAIAIFDFARQCRVPVFSSSSLRYITGMKEVLEGSAGKITGVEAFSPAPLEKTHPDLFWYGIHGVEILFTAMGAHCRQVVRIASPGTDVVAGTWEDGRIGTFRGIRSGKKDYGGTVFGENAIVRLGPFNNYLPLLEQIIRFFDTGIVPVSEEETLAILAFMEAADLSKKKGGVPVNVDEVMKKAISISKRKPIKSGKNGK